MSRSHRDLLPRFFILCAVVLGVVSCAHQPTTLDPTQKEANIKKLIELENITGQIRQISGDDLRQKSMKTLSYNQNLSQEEIQILATIMMDVTWEDIAQYVDQTLVPLYSSRFSDQEVVDLITFFSTGTGKKYAESSLILKVKSLDLAMKTMKDWSEKSQTQAYHDAMMRKMVDRMPESLRMRMRKDILPPKP